MSRADAIAGALASTVYLVGAGPGDPDLLTVRGAELLATADVILHDELVHPALLSLARVGADVRSVGKRGGSTVAKAASQSAIDAELIAHARAGRSVVRLKGGDPMLFGRGSEEAEALAAAGVRFEIVPGVASPLGASAYAGIPLTHRDRASSVTFVSGTTRAGKPFDWAELSAVTGTICVFMGMRRLDEVASALLGAGRDASTPCAVIQWATRPEQAVVTGRLDEIAALAHAAGLGSPAMIVIGAATELRRAIAWFDTRPLFGKRVLVTRAEHQAAATSRLLRRRGAEPIELAAIEIVAPPDPERVDRAVRELSTYDVVVFTSENGVTRLWTALDRAGRDARAFGAARVAAIGPGTAAALADRGVRADLIPSDYRGEQLAAAILADPDLSSRTGKRRALVARAKVAREVVPDTLRSAGFDVDVVPVYEARPPPSSRRQELIAMLEARRLDIVLFTSSSTVDRLCELLGDRADLLSSVTIASIGPITAETATRRGLRVAVTAAESTIPGLIDALERHLAVQSPAGDGPRLI